MDDSLNLPKISKRSLEAEFVTVKCSKDGQFCNAIDTCSNHKLKFKCVSSVRTWWENNRFSLVRSPGSREFPHGVSFCVDASDLADQ